MLEIIKALLKDPAGLSANVKHHVENWLTQEIYNQGDSQYLSLIHISEPTRPY